MKNKIHWNIFKRQWTSHTYKHCLQSDVVLVEGDWKTEVKPEYKTNPRGWIYCDHSQVTIDPDQEVLNKFEKVKRLEYDKINMKFNFEEGTHLLCDKQGCFLLKERV